ncbi:hypothetical protein ACLQ2P_03090 [Actinomadura citrea]|uniref:hypothetical protein n=1 Tax=Actinomadura citrea TaxID=46158 RepID=UPI003CE51B1A
MKDTDTTPNILEYELVRWLAERPFNRDEFVIVGSAPLLAHGIGDGVLRDLDVVACGSTWRQVHATGVRGMTGTITGAPVVSFCGGRVHFSETWFGPRSTRELLDRAEIIGGLRFASLPDVLDYKRVAGRDKDLRHIEAVERFLKSVETIRHGIGIPAPAA